MFGFFLAIPTGIDGVSLPTAAVVVAAPAPAPAAPAVVVAAHPPARPGWHPAEASTSMPDGYGEMVETSASWAAGTDAVRQVPGYSARLDASLCAAKPWMCDPTP